MKFDPFNFSDSTYLLRGERYFHVGGCKPADRGSRLKASDVVSIPGFWADIDFAGKDTAKKYPDESSAWELLRCFVWQPTFVVNTGGGLHAYWLFREPLEIDDANRAEIALASQKFQAYLRAHFEKRGFTIDSTHDLARLMRVWGTPEVPVFNTKYDPPRPVEIVENGAWEYNYSDIVEGLPDLPNQAAAVRPMTGERPRLILDPRAEPNYKKLQALIEYHETFPLTWGKKRTDLKDSSDSGYSAAIARAGADHGWTDQEIVDAVIHWRIKFGASGGGKVNRPDWYEKLLEMARSKQPDTIKLPDDPVTADPSAAAAALAEMSAALGIEGLEVIEVCQHGFLPNIIFTLTFSTGQVVEIGDYDCLKTFRKFALKVEPAIRHIFRTDRNTQKKWENVIYGVFKFALTEKVHEDAAPEDELKGKIDAYVLAGRDRELSSRLNAVNRGYHYVDDTHIYICVDRLVETLNQHGDKITAPALRRRMGAFGFDQATLDNGLSKKDRVQRRFWSISKERYYHDNYRD